MVKSVQELVNEQVAEKIAAGEELERAVADVATAQAHLDQAEAVAARSRRSALKSGWTEVELRSLGLASRARNSRTGRAASPRSAGDTSSTDA